MVTQAPATAFACFQLAALAQKKRVSPKLRPPKQTLNPLANTLLQTNT